MFITTLIISAALSFNPATADPTPPPSWGGIKVIEVSTCKCSCCIDGKCSDKPKATAPEIPNGTSKEISPEPYQMHRLTDKYGVAWEHKDKDYLQKYINYRNSLVPATQFFFQGGSSCATGNCPR